ncbi:Thiol-disulfide oxidoreductase resA [Kingella potus]|uniref:Thiol-disulfide oxidoreductase resA n=1 Tax=Kingella potus TaxID=265175 RepID=A0A377R108_9NEIS|nr:protein disulfide oxidoreductase [Kingella potus]UOP00847.1 protein disulfide oxidoreductase [Kingella potus]STR00488.1 Thiol-disulfide oxidoreductase resA [Kingella potus]
MKSKLFKLFKQSAQILLLVAVISIATDWLRRPTVPADAAAMAVPTSGGQTATLAQISSKQTAVLYFWGSWCGICKYTSPAVQRLHAEGTPVVGVALKSGSEAEVRAYMRRQGLDFALANDPQGDTAQQWGIKVTPTIVLVKNGRIVHSTTGIAGYLGLAARIRLADRLG